MIYLTKNSLLNYRTTRTTRSHSLSNTHLLSSPLLSSPPLPFPSLQDAHLLLASIALAGQNYRLATSSLEQALSYDFTVRSLPWYQLLKG